MLNVYFHAAVYIVKDLVPDLTQFYKQYKSIEPYLQNPNPPEKGTSASSLITPLSSSHVSLHLHRRVPSVPGGP